MDNIDAVHQLIRLEKSDTWDKLSTSDRVAIRKAITALRNIGRGYQLHEIDNGMPIRYFTKGDIECHKDCSNGGYYISVNGRNVISVMYGGENCRGQRGEALIYDNSIDNMLLTEVLMPLLRDNALLIHDAFDEEEWKQIDKERKEKMKKEG